MTMGRLISFYFLNPRLKKIPVLSRFRFCMLFFAGESLL